jgi:energy-coupling factor transporter ATP-binding protein EcfA2
VSSKKQTNIKETTANSTRSKISTSKVNRNCPPDQQINILLLGQTGVGKSTFINALANYLCNDTLEQAVNDNMQVLAPSSFSVTDKDTFELRIINIGQECEEENSNEIGQSCTQKCRSFVFPIGDQILRLIETPAIGDTRGFEQDIKNLDDIITYIAQYERLNGICIFLKPNEERPNILFRYCLNELLRHLPKSAIENIIFVFTNARSTHFKYGSTESILQVLLDQHEKDYYVKIPFTKQNMFLLDNEPFRYLAFRENGIHINNEQTFNYKYSWNHTIKEYARLIAYVTTLPGHAIRDTVLLNDVEQLIRILATEYINLSSMGQLDKHANNLLDEETKIEDVYKKLCKFLLANAILPLNDDLVEYLAWLILEQQMKKKAGDVINHLQTIRSKYAKEINLFKKTLENERNSANKIQLIQAKDIFPLVSTLYKLPINGQRIREQVEQLKLNQKKTEKRENFVQLPTKANSSKLMLQLKETLSNSSK